MADNRAQNDTLAIGSLKCCNFGNFECSVFQKYHYSRFGNNGALISATMLQLFVTVDCPFTHTELTTNLVH